MARFLFILIMAGIIFVSADELNNSGVLSFALLGSAQKEINITCIQYAIDKKYDLLKDSRETLAAQTEEATINRREALLEAWDISSTEDRVRALEKVNENFKDTILDANQIFESDKQEIHLNYQLDLGNCNAPDEAYEV